MIPVLHRSIDVLQRSMRRAAGAFACAHRRNVSRQSGFALLVVMTTVAVLGAVVGEFGYNARVELEAAANARDSLRAEYLARSGINLSRLLIKVQTSLIDPLNRQMQSDFQITEFAPYLMAAFGGGDEEKKAMGDMLGIDTSSVKGLGSGKGGSFDVVLGTEDGKININCGGGFPVGMTPQLGMQNSGNNPPPSGQTRQGPVTQAGNLYNMLVATMFPPRYNPMFERAGADGQFYTRDDIARAIIDWSDLDEAKFDPLAAIGGSGGNEDYHYDTLRDPYKARNNYYDTTEEVTLVKGVNDAYWGWFGSMFTVYGGCQINIRAVTSDNWPITAAIIRAAADNPDDPLLRDDTIVAALSQQIGILMQVPGLLSSPQALINAAQGGATVQLPKDSPMAAIPLPFPGLPGVKLNLAKLSLLVKTPLAAPREIYRIESTGSIKRAGTKKIQVRIRAIFDTKTFNQNVTSQDPNDFRGTWRYWRVE